jgi:hypothetical protein
LWTLDEYSRHGCDDYSHKHISRSQATRYDAEGRVRWLRKADSQGEGAILSLTAAPASRHEHAAPVNRVTVRDLSCRVGAELAIAVSERKMWAQVMLSHISMRTHDSERETETYAS